MAQGKYYREIDSLRALAVIAVIINHFNKDWLSGGFLGVDIFFVISGFVVTASLQGKENLPFKEFIKGFYSRRIKRLWPALASMVLIFSIPMFLFFGESENYVKTGFYSLLGLSNIFLYQSSSDYFSVSTESNPFMHTWSLGVEEQFYLIFPLLFYFSTKKSLFVKWVLGLSFVTLVSFLLIDANDSLMSFYMMPLRFWQFGLGVLAFNLSSDKFTFSNKHFILVPLISVITVLVKTSAFNSISAALVSVFTAWALICIKSSKSERMYLTFTPILRIGLMSYSLYLFHWPVLVFFKEMLPLDKLNLLIIFLVITSFALFSYKWIEFKLRTIEWSKTAYVTVSLVLLLGLTLKEQRDVISKWIFLGINKIEYSLESDSRYSKKLESCYTRTRSSEFPKNVHEFGKLIDSCQFIVGNSSDIYFFGNSYAEEKLPAVLKYAEEEKLNLFFYGRSQIRMYPYDAVLSENDEESRIMTNNFFNYLKLTAKKGDIAIISSPLYHFTRDEVFFDENDQIISEEKAFEVHSQFLLEMRNELSSRGIELYVFGGYPVLESEVIPNNCLDVFIFETQRCLSSKLVDTDETKEILELDVILAKKLGDNYIQIFDIIESAIKKHEKPWSLYFDHSHLSLAANQLIYPALEQVLSERDRI